MTAALIPAQADPATPTTAAPQVNGVRGGVDTHKDFHHAAAIDHLGRHLAQQWFPATRAGYAALLTWLRGFGMLLGVGVEGTGSYGAGLARYLAEQGVEVVEVNRPDRALRRRQGKSDVIDAYAAAEATASGRAAATPKDHTAAVEAIRVLRETRDGAIKARTAAINTLKSLITTGPEPLRDALRGLRHAQLLAACAALPEQDHPGDVATQATITALASHTTRIQTLNTEIAALDKQLTTLVRDTAPTTTAIFGAGTDTAGQLLITAGHNIDRLTSESALAALCGASPIPASSGKTTRHRLNRAGDRQANKALYRIIIVRLRHHQPTRDYLNKRLSEGKTKKEAIRCLKRHLVREIYRALRTDLASTLDTQ